MIDKKPITFFEYQSKELDKKYIIKLEKISNKKRLKINVLANNKIKPSQFVGVIQIGNKTLQFLPKIFSSKFDYDKDFNLTDDINDEKNQIFENLLYMLSYTKKLKIKETDIAKLSESKNLYEVIVYLFAKNLIEILRKDLHKNYVPQEDNLNFLKGKLLFNTHIRKNLFNKAKFHCEYDEFTENNLLNQVLRAAVIKCLKVGQFKRSFKFLSICDLILTDVDLKHITPQMCKKVTFNRLNKEFENVFNLAKIILFGNSTNLNSQSTDSFSFMFDMNVLFEEFIFEVLKKNSTDFLIRAENPRKNIFKNDFQMKPDITVYDLNDNVCNTILDTKYKKITYSDKKFGVSQSDVYQMFTYSKIYKVKELTLIYPKYKDEFKEQYFEGNGLKLKIRTIDLQKSLLDKNIQVNVFEEINNLTSFLLYDVK